jgi:hypothetical protein
MEPWKAFEAEAARLFGGRRYPANTGERADFSGSIRGRVIRGQCKLVKRLSLESITRLAEEPGIDVVCLKVRRGSGRRSPMLVIFTAEKYRELHAAGEGHGR